jgi:hypothetical protein
MTNVQRSDEPEAFYCFACCHNVAGPGAPCYNCMIDDCGVDNCDVAVDCPEGDCE